MEVKDLIIEKAGDMFWHYGARSVTMDDIARELSISKKTIYQYFRDKNELVRVVTHHSMEEERLKGENIFEVSEDAIDELHMISQYMRDHMDSINPAWLFDLQKYHKDAWNIYLDYKQNVFQGLIANSIKRGIDEGYFRPEINAEILATFRIEQIEMAFNDAVFPRSKFDFKEVQLQLLELFVNGIITDKGRERLSAYIYKQHS